ncbi:MAG: ketopantoate reductase family protein [Crenarchaeota archaeon]|nr:ketopantoate reductase family protein [Thermoproteota archaeon]
MPRICIVGCGAVGCLLAGFLQEALGIPPICIVRRREHYEALKREGCFIEGKITRTVKTESFMTGELEEGSCDIAIVAVKAYDAKAALEEASRLSKTVALASNGFVDVKPLIDRGIEVLGVIVEYGVIRKEDNKVEVTGLGRLLIGSYRGGDKEEAEQLAHILSKGGADVVYVDDIVPYQWAKAAVNAGLNAVTAILGVRNRVVAENEWAKSLALRAAEEVSSVAKAMGVRLPYTPGDYLLDIASKTGLNKSSMLQDVEAGRRTEVDEIIGYVIKRGEELGVSTPILKYLYMLIKALEETGGRVCHTGRR